jgi:hypothetical protein
MNRVSKHKYKRAVTICNFYLSKALKDLRVRLIINLTMNINKTTKIKIHKQNISQHQLVVLITKSINNNKLK